MFGVVLTNSCLIGIKPTQKEEIHAQYCILDISIIHISISIIQALHLTYRISTTQKRVEIL